MRLTARLSVLALIALVGLLPVLRASCDLACDSQQHRDLSAAGPCASHEQTDAPQPEPASNERCGHDHASIGAASTSAARSLAPPVMMAGSFPVYATADIAIEPPFAVVHVAARGTPGPLLHAIPLRI